MASAVNTRFILSSSCCQADFQTQQWHWFVQCLFFFPTAHFLLFIYFHVPNSNVSKWGFGAGGHCCHFVSLPILWFYNILEYNLQQQLCPFLFNLIKLQRVKCQSAYWLFQKVILEILSCLSKTNDLKLDSTVVSLISFLMKVFFFSSEIYKINQSSDWRSCL